MFTNEYLDGFRCSGCGHFTRPTIIDYSNKLERNSSHDNLAHKTSERRKALELLLKPNFRLLEIGCAEGALGKEVKSLYQLSYDGVELSKDKDLASAVLDFVTDDKKKLSTQAYDGILSFHVLEHIQDLENEIKAWKSLLKPKQDSFLVVEVPYRAGHQLLYHDLNSEHVHQFTVASLTRLFEMNGFYIQQLYSGCFESPLYNDSLRMICRLRRTQEEVEGFVLKNFERCFPNGFYVWGCGGDFSNYLLPLLTKLNILGLIDTDPGMYGKQIDKFIVSGFTNEILKGNVLISTLRFKDVIRNELLSKGVRPENIRGIDEVYNLQRT